MCIGSAVRRMAVVSSFVLLGMLAACSGGSDNDRVPLSSGNQQSGGDGDASAGGGNGGGSGGGTGDSGDDSSGDGSNRGTPVSLYFSDAPLSDAARVVISVDRITFLPESGADIVVNTFTSPELGIDKAETFQLDLLQVQGTDKRMVIDRVNLPPGEYRGMRIEVLDLDVNESFVEELSSGEMRRLEVTAGELAVGGFTVDDRDNQDFVLEFSLRQALDLKSSGNHYILKSVALRLVSLERASTLRGTVDLNALATAEACADKADSAAANVAYLYKGHGLDPAALGDVFLRKGDPGARATYDPNVPDHIIAPYAASGVDAEGNYVFSYLLEGDYTLAVSCQVGFDNPVMFEELAMPSPATEWVEISLGAAQERRCNFPLIEGACATPSEE